MDAGPGAASVCPSVGARSREGAPHAAFGGHPKAGHWLRPVPRAARSGRGALSLFLDFSLGLSPPLSFLGCFPKSEVIWRSKGAISPKRRPDFKWGIGGKK